MYSKREGNTKVCEALTNYRTKALRHPLQLIVGSANNATPESTKMPYLYAFTPAHNVITNPSSKIELSDNQGLVSSATKARD